MVHYLSMVRRRMSFELKKVDEDDRTDQTQRKPSVKNQRLQDDKVECLLYTQPPRTVKGSATVLKLTLT
jgi:hypothetical protein